MRTWTLRQDEGIWATWFSSDVSIFHVRGVKHVMRQSHGHDLRRVWSGIAPHQWRGHIGNARARGLLYKLRILWDLQHGPRRYGEIRKKLLTGISGTKAVTPRVLSGELKNLVNFGLLKRTDRGVIPKRVEYELTPLGETLVPVISVMHKWGVRHVVRDSVLRQLGLLPEQKRGI